MAEIVIPEGHGECVFRWSVTGRSNPVSCTLGVEVTGPSTPDEVVNDLFDDLVGTESLPGMCNADAMYTPWTFLSVEGKFMVDGIIVAAASERDIVPGALSTANVMIVSSSLIVQKKTIRVGRRFRGRWYVPPLRVAEAAVDMMGNINPTDFATITAPISVSTSSILAATSYKPALLHAPGDSSLPPATIISSFAPLSKMATQRRRLRA